MEPPLDDAIESVDRHGGVAADAGKSGLLAYLPEAIVGWTAKVVWPDLAPKEIWEEYRYGFEFQSFRR